MKQIDIKIGDKIYTVRVAITEEEKANGLMHVESLHENEGMLFDYSDAPQKELAFWMKDTPISLDIVFINNQGIVDSVATGEPNSEDPIECVADDPNLLMYVLEVNANSNIKEGDRFEMFEDDAKKAGLIDSEEDLTEEITDEEVKMFILGPDGNPVHRIEPGVRIFSRIHTRELIKLVKHAHKTKEDSDYKKIAKKLFKIIEIHNTQDQQYVEAPSDGTENS